MTVKVFICTEEQVIIYSSIEEAEKGCKISGVLRGGYEVFDFSGNYLDIYVVKGEVDKVKIAIPDITIYKGLRLKIILRDWIERSKNIELGYVNDYSLSYLIEQTLKLRE